ncbi:MAG: ABC transporter ATP-binding protein [Daejeonella sp.]
MTSTPQIRLQNVAKYYSVGNTAAISDVNITINKGDFVAIIGESGSGKSTLLKLIFGLLSPNSGEVYYADEHVLGPHEKLIPGHEKMKMVTQDFNLNLYAKVYDNIAGMLSNEDVAAKKQKTWEMMEFLGIDHLSEKRIVELSGGEQQRVAIARAIITEPEVLLLDEPFSQIDAILKNQLRADLKRLCTFLGITIILVSHDPQDGLSLSNHLILIKNGKVIQQGVPAEIANNPVSAYVGKILGNANIISQNQAETKLNISPEGHSKVLIYPHHILITGQGIKSLVSRVNFKMYFDELELNVNGLNMHANVPSGKFNKGDEVYFTIEKYSLVNL